MLENQFKYYLAHQAELVEKFNGRFLIIKDEMVKGDFKSQADAYEAALSQFEAGTFIIQHCTQGSEGYTNTFHSQVIIHSTIQL